MKYASNIFVSYRLFIAYLKSMHLKFTFEFLVTFFVTSPLTSKETCFKFYTKFDKMSLITERTKNEFRKQYNLHYSFSLYAILNIYA